MRMAEGTPYEKMNAQQKARFVFKLVICIMSFGFVFPNVMSD
jgi:hypothetical protein